MKFILYLIFINFILFLPRYLVGLPRYWNPLRFLFSNDTIAHKAKSIYFSRIIDPFRLSMEYSLVALFLFFMGWKGELSIWVLSFVALIIFVFNIYVGVFLVLLKKTPILKSDWFFLRESVSIYEGYFLLIIGLALLLLGLIFYGIYHLHIPLTTMTFDWRYGIVFLFFVGIFGLFHAHHFNVTDYFSRSVFSVLLFGIKSRKQSQAYEKLFKLKAEDIKKHNHFSDISLKEKPNIHIISMESYGSVLLKDKEKYGEVMDLLGQWNDKFSNSTIHCSSIYSLPPLFATGTWYSYSTLLFGMLIDNGALQNTLFSEMSSFDAYQSLFRFTKNEGYTNYLLQGMIGEFEGTLDFKKLQKNLNYDHLIYNKDLEYKGQLLKFMNLQNCVPDQYTLNRGLDISERSKDPYTLFFCTLNSHWDFYSPLRKVDNWNDINNSDFAYDTTTDRKYNRVERYTHSIKYTIDSVFDTILNRMKPNDIYIVYGDHQPTMITDEKYGKETPMHIFSQNKDFLKQWEAFGFKPGIVPKEGDKKLKFEAFYSAFMSCINATYGEDPKLEVPFFKDGIDLVE